MDKDFELSQRERFDHLLFRKEELSKSNDYYHRIHPVEAAAVDNKELCKKVSRQFKETAGWWQKYAAHEVSSVEAVDPFIVYRAAEGVAQALNVWHKGGAATGDIAPPTPTGAVPVATVPLRAAPLAAAPVGAVPVPLWVVGSARRAAMPRA